MVGVLCYVVCVCESVFDVKPSVSKVHQWKSAHTEIIKREIRNISKPFASFRPSIDFGNSEWSGRFFFVVELANYVLFAVTSSGYLHSNEKSKIKNFKWMG